MRRKTLDEFKNEIEKINDTIEIIGDYINCKTPVQFKCKICNNVHSSLPNTLLHGSGCPKCAIIRRAKKRTKSHDNFVKRVFEINPNIKIIGEYKNYRSKIEFVCLQCNKHFFTDAGVLLAGHGCNYCEHQKGFEKRRKNQEQFEQEMIKIHPTITVLDKYGGAKKKINCYCNVCGNKWENTPDRLINKRRGCPKCTMIKQVKRMSKTTEIFKSELYNINDSLEVIGEYVNNVEKILIKCNKCGQVFDAIPRNLLNRGNCPLCISSKGEDKIANVLSQYQIEFYSEKTFDNLLSENNGHLRYDFFLPNYNLLIEYQGVQHNKPIDFGSKGQNYAENQLKKQQRNDEIKRQFAKDNGYNYLEIWYYDFDKIENIINNELQLIKK